MAKFKKVILSLLIISLIVSVTVFPTHAAQAEGAITFATVNNAKEDTDYYATLSSTTDKDYWYLTSPAEGFVNFYIGSVPSNSTYKIELLKGSSVIAYATTSGKTNATIKCKVDGSSTYNVRVSFVGGTNNTTDQYLFRYKTFETITNVKARLFSFQVSAVNSTTAISKACDTIIDMGVNSYEYLNNTVSAAYSVLPSSDIFVVSSKGVDNDINFYKSATSITHLYANKSSPGTNNRSLSALASAALSDVELAIYIAGTSADFTTISEQKGAFCAIGFTGNPTFSTSAFNEWTEWFFEGCKSGRNIEDAISYTAGRFEQKYASVAASVFAPANMKYTSTASALVFN